MGRREIQTMKILTGRTPTVRLRSRHLWKHVSSRLSQLRIVVSNWRK